ncbi:PH (Pleckstrin Homology) domain-containing protein [Pseudonocardia sediminis]|uniref:PH (Pleckstrin Homology) domain-containing protein n=1 Tax=Pseudonocardia sediminis TaxID=1397368 RepID=A0A4V6MED3_PSEST|nr:PH domain-containing protein [Pseudonocardia sediminis]RZT87960.1 PH (Pleckstrin Homology) domain-containing protein [Pseudonocardia sediminis]
MSSTDPSTPAETDAESAPAPPPRLVFKHSALGILAGALFVVCALPLMLSVPYFWLVLLVPVGFAVWLLRVRTTVDTDSVTARSFRGSRRVPWDDISSLRLGARSSVSAVLKDDTELPLPAVHLRDLPALAVVSGGRISDPAGDL